MSERSKLYDWEAGWKQQNTLPYFSLSVLIIVSDIITNPLKPKSSVCIHFKSNHNILTRNPPKEANVPQTLASIINN